MTEDTPAVEQWLPVPGYEGLYDVSDQGRVRSHRRKGAPGRIRKPQTRGTYLSLMLYREDQPKEWRIQALVAAAFLGPRPDGLLICHRDGDPHNNRPTNLYYGTWSDNNFDTVRHGRHVNARKTHCAQGHPYSADNTDRKGTQRRCRTCLASKYGRTEIVA
jgi:hypothetical protein